MSDLTAETQTETGVRRTGHGRQRLVQSALLAMGLSTLVYVLAVPVGGVDLRVGEGDGAQTVALPSVLVVSAVAVFVAALTRRVLARRARGVLVWNVLAGAGLVLSLAGPAGAATSGAWLTLTAMHLVVGSVILVGQRWTASTAPVVGVA